MFLFNIETSRLISNGACRSELAVARELAPAGLRSGPKIDIRVGYRFGSAAHSSGSKLPRHTSPCTASPNASHSTAIPGRARTPPRCSSR
ncbi:hypothetical protein FJ692_20805 [Pseudomonas fluorescens]|nr:hypothetical protein FJ692_20805 [Pseudomonas fluorescens]